MSAIRHSTKDVPTRQSLEYWNDWVCGSFVNMDCHAERGEFSGSIVAHPISNLLMTQMRSDKMELIRSASRIAKGREDCYLIAVEGRTTSALLQDGRDGVLHAGDFAIVDSSRPYAVRFHEYFEHVVIRIPRQEIAARLGRPDRVTGISFNSSHGAAKIASSVCRMLAADIEHIAPSALEQVAVSLLDLFSVAIGEQMTNQSVNETTTRNAWLVRIRNYIEAHLSDPNLSRLQIALALGISVRYLSDILKSNDMSVMSYIADRRLSKCDLALSDPAQNGRSISEIAFGWGFNDLSHFGRAFRTRYGLSPKERREQARTMT